MNFLNSIDLARERALAFEDEYRRAIEELHHKEAEARELTKLRMAWFTSETSTSSLEYEVFKRKMELLERRGDVLEAKAIIDKYRLEGYYETQQLKQLIAATKPGSKSDKDGKKRSQEMEAVMREGSEVLARALQDSIMFRQNLLSESKSLQGQLDVILSERDSRAEKYSKLLDESLAQFVSGVESTHKACKANFRKITGQYLVLRHNSRIASELIARSQNEAELERARLQESMEQCRQMAADRIASAEESYRSELETRLQILRSEVMGFEVALEGKWQKNDDVRLEWRKTHSRLKKDIKQYNEKYQNLQRTRYHEISVVQTELDGLRDDIVNAEAVLLGSQTRLKSHLRDTMATIKLGARSATRKGVNYGYTGVSQDDGLMLQNLQRRVNDLKIKVGDSNETGDSRLGIESGYLG